MASLPSSLARRRLCGASAVALSLLVAPAGASAAAGPSTASMANAKPIPSVRTVRPMKAAIGSTLTIRGRNFLAGRAKNTVVFQRTGSKAVFVKAGIGTRRLVKVQLPDRLEASLVVRAGVKVATRFRIRILSARFGRRFTSTARSPLIAPKPAPVPPPPARPVPPPDIDCDLDGLLNSKDSDDDGDLLSDAEELAVNAQLGAVPGLRLGTCKADSDGDSVLDGFEFRSARDLNASSFQPFPGKRPYPNPLQGDETTDFDGDGLTLSGEFRLSSYELKRTGRAASLDSLSYSDGTQHSVYVLNAGGRRTPALSAVGYERQVDFQGWLAATGFGTVDIPGDSGPRSLLDVNRDGEVSTAARDGYPTSEERYYDADDDGVLSDDERDEDADGITNIEEANLVQATGFLFRLDREYWRLRYPGETPFKILYEGSEFDDPDVDGDGIRDGADDQDYDDVPNLMELSRQMATGSSDSDGGVPDSSPRPQFGRVNPFNPCLPDPASRTCPRYVPIESPSAPFDGSANYFIFD